ncbi:MAG: hypothetical protein ABI910_06365 [Gemmatimonadota bacterium]
MEQDLARLFETLLDARDPGRLRQLEDELELRWPDRPEAVVLARCARFKRERLGDAG